MIDVGAAGREGDAGIFATSKFENLLSNFEQGILPNLELPVPSQLPCSRRVMPYVFVGDEAFGLRENLMRPYPGRGRGTLSLIEKIFNYRYYHIHIIFSIYKNIKPLFPFHIDYLAPDEL